jgi:hypothetical protein
MVADMARDATAKGVESWPANLRIDPEVSACGNTSGWSYPERDVYPVHTCQEIFFLMIIFTGIRPTSDRILCHSQLRHLLIWFLEIFVCLGA